MNWLSNFARPKLKALFSRRESPENLWVKCGNCGDMIFQNDLVSAQHVCPSCNFHMKVGPNDRLASLFDDGKFDLMELPEVPADPLKFRDEKKYTNRIKEARSKTGQTDAMVAASGTLDGIPVVIGVQNFAFMGGSLGMAAGEAIIKAAEVALENKSPLLLFTAAGGARMQEGIMSLMQMPRTTIAIQMLKDAHLPYIVVLTDPTTGGVTASYAMLGDVQISEPGALIGFAGPRVIEQTIREKLPEGFQRAEYLFDHGMLDMVVHRHELRAKLSSLISLLMNKNTKDLRESRNIAGAEKSRDETGDQSDQSVEIIDPGDPADSRESAAKDISEAERRIRLAGQTP